MPENELDLDMLAGEALKNATPAEGETAPPERTRRTRSDKGVPRRPRGPAAGNLAAELLNPIAKFSKAIAMSSPTAAAVLIEDGERTANALVAIAKRHPKMLKALQNVSQIGPVTDLFETAFKVGLALQLDIGRIPPTHPLAIITGVSKLYHEIHPPSAEGSQNGQFVPPPPGPILPTDSRHPMYSWRAGAPPP